MFGIILYLDVADMLGVIAEFNTNFPKIRYTEVY